jgi:cytochrome c oxidase subunit 2
MGSWPLDPRGVQAESIAFVYWVLFAFAVVVLAIVVGALTYSGIKFRDRPGRVAQQFHGSNTLELVWTIVPTLMVISFTALSWDRLNLINDVDTNAAMTVKVEGTMWAWAFTYPDQQMFKLKDGSTIITGERLDIPVGQKIKLELTAKDVIHSFWVPNIGGKKDAVPGHTTTMWIQADEPGTYKGQCTEFCGDGHADMLITVVAHPANEFATWAAEEVAFQERLQDPATTAGREAFLAGACAGCHLVKGTRAVGRIGPELTNIASKPTIADVLPMNEENLRRWVRNAPALKPGVLMPKFEGALPDDQINAIVQWLLVLK